MQKDNFDYELAFEILGDKIRAIEKLVGEMAYLWKCQGAVFENDLLSQEEN